MSVSKIEVSIGNFRFLGEGDEKWLSIQLDKILKEGKNFIHLSQTESSKEIATAQKKNPESLPSLAKVLRDNGITTNQNKKFLGAAVFLNLRGKKQIKTSDVTVALRDAGQTRIGNPSARLAANIKQGFLEKVGDGFMVTVNGLEEFNIKEY